MCQQTKPVVLGIEKDKKQFTRFQICFAQKVEEFVFLLLPRDCLTSPLNYLSKIMIEMHPCSQKIKSLVFSAMPKGLRTLHRTKLNYLSRDNLGADVADWVIFHGNLHSAHFKSPWKYNVLSNNAKHLNRSGLFIFTPKAFQISWRRRLVLLVTRFTFGNQESKMHY